VRVWDLSHVQTVVGRCYPRRVATPDRIGFLRQELARWVEQGLISVEQQERILALYDVGASSRPLPPAESAGLAARPEQRRVSAWLPAILITMAVLLIGVGLTLFYAANWRKMAPGLKLAQIAGLLVLIHGGSFALLFGKRRFPIAGRGLLVLGMLAFGAAIGLVAQTYHISAHPTHGLLLWLIGVIALSAVMQERIGYHLGLGLILLWHLWELDAYGHFNPGFLPLLAVLALLLYRAGDKAGLLVCGLQALLWLWLADLHWIDRIRAHWAEALTAFFFLQLPLGLCLIALSRLRRPELLSPAAAVLGAIGWICLFAPLIGLSWPMSLGDSPLPFFATGLWPLLVEHVALCVVAGLLLLRLRRQGERGLGLLLAVLLYGALALVLPLNQNAVRLVFCHLGLVGLVLGMLHDGHRAGAGRAVQRVLAFVLAVATLFVKSGVFLIMGEVHGSYFVAYALGALILVVVIFLCNRCVPVLLAREAAPVRYPLALLDGLSALAAFGVLYAAAFKLHEQSSVLDAGTVVLILLAVFIALALALYAFLWRRSPDRLPLGLSAVVFGAALVLLVVARPAVPWQLYSVAFNLLLLVLQGLLLVHATRVNSIALANLVMIAFALQVATRYFDIFWDLLSGSLLFIVTGVVVFAGGFLLERNRRRLVRHIKEGRA
jgi:uncharacterized membrane protein